MKDKELSLEEKTNIIFDRLEANRGVVEAACNYIAYNDPTYSDCNPPFAEPIFCDKLNLNYAKLSGHELALLGYIQQVVEERIKNNSK